MLILYHWELPLLPQMKIQSLRYRYQPREQKVARIITSLKVIYKEILIFIHNGLLVCKQRIGCTKYCLTIWASESVCHIKEVHSNVTITIFACQHNKEQYLNKFILIYILNLLYKKIKYWQCSFVTVTIKSDRYINQWIYNSMIRANNWEFEFKWFIG